MGRRRGRGAPRQTSGWVERPLDPPIQFGGRPFLAAAPSGAQGEQREDRPGDCRPGLGQGDLTVAPLDLEPGDQISAGVLDFDFAEGHGAGEVGLAGGANPIGVFLGNFTRI